MMENEDYILKDYNVYSNKYKKKFIYKRWTKSNKGKKNWNKKYIIYSKLFNNYTFFYLSNAKGEYFILLILILL